MAGVIGLRGPDIDKRDALRGYKIVWKDADRPIVRPHTGLPVLRLADGKPVVERHVFGFSKKYSSFNARADRLEESNMWMKMFGKSHGVAPVSYILEWADMGDGKKPYRIERADGAAMAVPALVGGYWEDRKERAFALVTVEPNGFFAKFHDRMVGQLADDQIDVWLHPEAHDTKALFMAMKSGLDDELLAYPISPKVGSADENDASALEAIGPPVANADLAPKKAAKKATQAKL